MGATTLYNFRTKVVDWTPTLNTDTHAAGDVVSGDGGSTGFETVTLGEGGSAVRPLRVTINYAIIHDGGAVGAQFDILISDDSTVAMGAAPSAAAAMTDAHAKTILGVIDTSATWATVGSTGKFAKPAAFSPIPFELSGDSLYMGIIARASWNVDAATDITVRFGLTIE